MLSLGSPIRDFVDDDRHFAFKIHIVGLSGQLHVIAGSDKIVEAPWYTAESARIRW